jgi:protein-disulfide isomerase
MVLATMVIAAILVYREFWAGPDEPPILEPIAASEWIDVVARGHAEGPSDARDTIVAFIDFECPACRAVDEQVLRPLLAQVDAPLVLLRHWPLPYHSRARRAAHAAECAAEQGLFGPAHETLYALQDDATVDPIDLLASRLNIDSTLLTSCANGDSADAAVRTDEQLVRRLKGSGTPTLFINGHRLLSYDSAAVTRAREESRED